MLRDVERSANPWGKPQVERADWAEGLDVRVLEPGDAPPEVLFWVGCAPAYDERAREGARSTAKLLQAAGVDFAILGPRECCTGDPARRMGNEYTFQSYAQQNVETLGEAGVTKIVTTCPHCFNTLGNEYPDFGGSYEVMHHTELLAQLVRDGRLKPQADERKITYHDSCYLARHNDVRSDPRELIDAVGRGRRDAAQRQAHVLLRRRRRPHVDGGARRGDQRGARARGRRDRRRDARRRLPVLHRHARRRRALDRREARGRRRRDAPHAGRRTAAHQHGVSLRAELIETVRPEGGRHLRDPRTGWCPSASRGAARRSTHRALRR